MELGYSIGKSYRLNQLFPSVRCRAVVIPIDDSLIFGPHDGLWDLEQTLLQIVAGKPDAILCHKGTVTRHVKTIFPVPFILNLTASTVLSTHTKKIVVQTVDDAALQGAMAVAAHVNVSSRYEPEMLRSLAQISMACERLGLPLMAIMYPRTEREGEDYNYLDVKDRNREAYTNLVAHAVRIGVDLGADIIKTQFTGDADSFSRVIRASGKVPVLTAGGPKVSVVEALRQAFEAVLAGGNGTSFGRNTFNRREPAKFVSMLRQVVHEGMRPEDLISNEQERT